MINQGTWWVHDKQKIEVLSNDTIHLSSITSIILINIYLYTNCKSISNISRKIVSLNYTISFISIIIVHLSEGRHCEKTCWCKRQADNILYYGYWKIQLVHFNGSWWLRHYSMLGWEGSFKCLFETTKQSLVAKIWWRKTEDAWSWQKFFDARIRDFLLFWCNKLLAHKWHMRDDIFLHLSHLEIRKGLWQSYCLKHQWYGFFWQYH